MVNVVPMRGVAVWIAVVFTVESPTTSAHDNCSLTASEDALSAAAGTPAGAVGHAITFNR